MNAAELASVRAFIDEVGEGPSALVLEGDAGIGKSSLFALTQTRSAAIAGELRSSSA